MKKILCLILALLMCATLFAGCGADNSDASDKADDTASDNAGTNDDASDDAASDDAASDDGALDSEYVKEKGTLIVGITDFEPMDYKEEDSEEWIGFDADMAKAFAASLGVTAEFIEIDWDNKIMELGANAIDCVWNGMTLTDEVINSMETSNAYCNNAQVVVVSADKADQYNTVERLSELAFAAENGSAGEKALKDLGIEPVGVLTQADALMEVASGTSDACVIDLLMAGAMIGEGTSYPDLVTTVELTTEEYGVGFRKGSDLAQLLNEFFASAYADGSMMKIAETYGVQKAVIEQ